MLPFNVAVAVAFQLIFYGMAGMRHGAYHVARSTLVAVLLALIATQARAPSLARLGGVLGAGTDRMNGTARSVWWPAACRHSPLLVTVQP